MNDTGIDDQLSAAIQKIADDAGDIVVEIADVTGNIDHVTERVNIQALSFERVGDASAAMADAKNQIAQATANSLNVATQANDDVIQSRHQIASSISTIERLVQFVQNMEGRLTHLEKALHQVRDVSATIQTIAAQTNLLALNATIEAARAGDMGKGFAVVAGEVKNLAGQTAQATEQIDLTLSGLKQQVESLMGESEQGIKSAKIAQNGTKDIGDAINLVGNALEKVNEQLSHIDVTSQAIDTHVDGVVAQLTDMNRRSQQNKTDLKNCNLRLDSLRSHGEGMIRMSNQLGVETVDSFAITAARNGALEIGKAFEDGIKSGQVRERDLFDRTYTPVAGTNPQKHSHVALEFYQQVLPAIQNRIRGENPKFTMCCAVDDHCYLPVHNPEYSKDQKLGKSDEEIAWNTAHSRHQMIWDHSVGKASAQNDAPFLLQAYRRELGNGQYHMTKDVSAPIYINGRKWGSLRCGYIVH